MLPQHKPRVAVIGNPNDIHLKRYLNRICYDTYDVTVVSPIHLPTSKPQKFKVFSQSFESFKNLKHIRYFYSYLKFLIKNNFDVTFCYAATPPLCWLAGISSRKKLETLTIGVDVFLDEQIPMTFIEKQNVKRLVKASHRIKTLSTAMFETLVKNFKVNKNILAYEFLEIESFWYDLSQPSQTEGRFSGRHPVLFSPRMMRELYRQKEIIKALFEVKKKYPNVLLVQTGYGVCSKYKKECVRLINDLSLKNNFLMMEVFEKTEEIIGVYDACDVVVMIPKSDGMPSSMIEAWSRKKPVLVSNIYNYEEAHNQKLFLKSETDAKNLSNSMLKLIQDQKLYKKIIQYSSKHLEDKKKEHSGSKLDFEEKKYSKISVFSKITSLCFFLCFLIEPWISRKRPQDNKNIK